MTDDAGDGAGQHVHRVGVGALAQDIGKGQRVQHEKALNGQKPQFPGPADQVGVGGDDAVGLRKAGDVFGGNIPGGHSFNQVDVDKGQLSRRLGAPDQFADVQNGSIKQKHHRAVGSQGPDQPLVMFDGGDNRSVLHGLYKKFQIFRHKRDLSSEIPCF